MLAAVLVSTMEVSGLPMTAAAPVSATVWSFLGFSSTVVTDQRMGDIT